MSKEEKNKKVEEKSLGSSGIGFFFEEKENKYNILKRYELDIGAISILIVFGLLLAFSLFNKNMYVSDLKEKNQLVEDLTTKHGDLKKVVKTINDIKNVNIEKNKYVSLFTYLEELKINYEMLQDKRTGLYYIFVEGYPINDLKKVINDGITKGVISENSRKELLLNGDTGSVKLIFN